MTKRIQEILLLEIKVLLIAVVLAFIFLGPYLYYEVPFPFYWHNLIFIFVFIVFAKHTFLLEHSFINAYQKLKILLIPLCIYLFFTMLRMLGKFTSFVESNALADIMPDFSYKNQQLFSEILRAEYIFFAVAAIVSCVAFPIKLFISIWREINR